MVAIDNRPVRPHLERTLLARLLPQGRTLVVVPDASRRPDEAVQLLERLREQGGPAFRTIHSITAERGVVVVELPPGRDPVPVPVDRTLVSCHLYPPDALAGG